MLFVLPSCEETEPVIADVFASDGGAGRTKTTASADEDDGTITICLDPGHGFDDVGTDSDYLGAFTEKDITLAVTLLIKDKLAALGYEVILTHDGESFPKSSIDDGNNLFNPKERIDSVSGLNIDFYLSIHCDTYAADSRVMGTRIYYSKDTDYTSQAADAAGCMLRGINTALPMQKKSVLKEMELDAAYYVVRAASVPSVLIEMGFVTNKTDAENMLSETWRESFAAGIAAGLDDYFNK